MSGKIGIHWMGWMGKRKRLYEFKSRSVCKFSLNGGAGIYTLMMNLKRDLDHRVLMIFFCACTFRQPTHHQLRHILFRIKSMLFPEKYEIFGNNCACWIKVLLTTRYPVFIYPLPFPPKKSFPQHNIVNKWWFLCWKMDGIFFVCLLYDEHNFSYLVG